MVLDHELRKPQGAAVCFEGNQARELLNGGVVPTIHGYPTGDLSGSEKVWLPRTELVELLNGPLPRSLPAGAGCGFNLEGDQAWIKVGKPGDTRQVLAAARALRDKK